GARRSVRRRVREAGRGGGRKGQSVDRTARAGRLRGPRDSLRSGRGAGAAGGVRRRRDCQPGGRPALGSPRADGQVGARRDRSGPPSVRNVAPLPGPTRPRERGHGRQGDRQTPGPRPERSVPRLAGRKRRVPGPGSLAWRGWHARRLDGPPDGPAVWPLADADRGGGGRGRRSLPVLQGLQGRLSGRAEAGRDGCPRGLLGHPRRSDWLRGQGGGLWLGGRLPYAGGPANRTGQGPRPGRRPANPSRPALRPVRPGYRRAGAPGLRRLHVRRGAVPQDRTGL
ncbi:MAG: hypothetical protein AVDCRST_MAG01-01-3388, partial [uncultured Rubrobacteraceae bacterium]